MSEQEQLAEVAIVAVPGQPIQVVPLLEHGTRNPIKAGTMSAATSPQTTAKHVAPGEAASKGRARQSKARVAANRDKVAAMNDAANEPTRRELVGKAQALGIRGATGMRKDALLAAIAQEEAAQTMTVPPARGSKEPTPAKAKAAERVAKLDALKANAAATPKTPSTAPTSGRPKASERGQQARAVKREKGKRGPGRKLTDAELTDYVRKARKAHPESSATDELEYAYWIEGLAVNARRWSMIWTMLDTDTASAA